MSSRLKLFMLRTAAYYGNHKNDINTPCGKKYKVINRLGPKGSKNNLFYVFPPHAAV